jgi:hypothetical protein
LARAAKAVVESIRRVDEVDARVLRWRFAGVLRSLALVAGSGHRRVST